MQQATNPICNKQLIKGYNTINSARPINRLYVDHGIEDCHMK